MPGIYTLGKNERLKSRKQLDELFSRGVHFNLAPFRVSFMIIRIESGESYKSQESWSRFGVGVSSRHFKKATDRNRMKRLIRENWRLQKNELVAALQQQQKQIHVFLIYTGRELTDYETIQKATASVIKKLIRKIDKIPT